LTLLFPTWFKSCLICFHLIDLIDHEMNEWKWLNASFLPNLTLLLIIFLPNVKMTINWFDWRKEDRFWCLGKIKTIYDNHDGYYSLSNWYVILIMISISSRIFWNQVRALINTRRIFWIIIRLLKHILVIIKQDNIVEVLFMYNWIILVDIDIISTICDLNICDILMEIFI
jgi:hypothetical protein